MSQNVRDYSMAAERALLAGLRDALRRQLERWSVSEVVARRFVLVVDEIFNNSIEHGAQYRKAGSRLELRVTKDAANLRLRFVDPDVTADIGVRLGQLLEAATSALRWMRSGVVDCS